jgi:uncharacterized membrane protein (UPF0127 family)
MVPFAVELACRYAVPMCVIVLRFAVAIEKPHTGDSCARFAKITPKGYMRYRLGVTELRKQDGTVVCERCETADSSLKRMKGLLGKSSLDADEGLLFPRTGSIHMLFMRFPIDAVFCDADLQVLDVRRGLAPWRFAAKRGAKVVIELADGAAAGVEVGDRLVLGTIEE